MPAKNVADLSLPGEDSNGDQIRTFYGRKLPEYAVYATDTRVLVHFADDAQLAARQRTDVAPLHPLRGEINGIVDGWRGKPDGHFQKRRADRYDRRVGDALVVAMEGGMPQAELLLRQIKEDVYKERVAAGRIEYLLAALSAAVLFLLLIAVFSRVGTYPAEGIAMWRAAAAGAAGAFFSITLAMRNRTVLPDLQRNANLTDAALRVFIGVIAAAVLMALIHADAVRLRLGDREFADPNYGWLLVLIAGFVAGFSERLVPDLLEKAAATTDRAPAPPPAPLRRGGSGTAAAQPSSSSDPPEPDALPEEAAHDACASDIEVPDEMITGDVDLPPASGGVAPVPDGSGTGAAGPGSEEAGADGDPPADDGSDGRGGA